MRKGKRYQEARKLVDRTTTYPLREAIELTQKSAQAKFDETIEMAIRLGIDPRHADQIVRGAVSLPHGTGKQVKVLVLAQGEKQKEAQEAGADYVGAGEYIDKISAGWLDFDAVIATPDMMKEVGKLGRILGPRGLMPNPKSGTVTFEVAKTLQEIKAGRIEFRTDRGANLHAPIGKASFDTQKLQENATTFLDAILGAKPQVAKGQYIRSITITSTMGPGVRVDRQSLVTAL